MKGRRLNRLTIGPGGGAPAEARTPDPRIKSAMLCRLSYGRILFLTAPTSLRGGVPGEGLSPSLGFALEGGVPNRTSKTAARGAEAPQQQRPHGILSQELWCLTRSLRSAAPHGAGVLSLETALVLPPHC